MITVFTPVYNRAHTIGQLYNSLLKQTSYDFEWLVIDDGSKDGIEELMYKWIKEELPFTIRFYQQENGGKHRAINRGVQLAEGSAFFIVDSDDYITEDAIETIHDWWKLISEDSGFAGVSGLKINLNGEIIGGRPVFETFVDATNLERRKYNLMGDKAEVYKTDVLKRYPFPEFDKENFLTEAVVWDQIAYDGLKLRWFNWPIMVCEYREDGLTSQGQDLFIRNPKGWGMYIQQKYRFRLSDGKWMQEYFDYYIEVKERLSNQEIKDNLQISNRILENIKKIHQLYVEETVNRIGKKIGLYGVGFRGRKLLKLFQGTEVEVYFVLDKKKTGLPLQIDLDQQYPVVDAIIVTPQKEQKEIISLLKEKTENNIIGYNQWELSIIEEIDKWCKNYNGYKKFFN